MDKGKEIYNVAGWIEGRHASSFDDAPNQIADLAAIDFFTRSKTGGQRIVVVSRAKTIDKETAKIFEELATQWYKDTLRLSSYLDKILHPAYQQIMGLGEKAIPFILRELQDFPAQWFWALENIARFNPVPEDVYKPSEMAKIWIAWGEDNDYL